VSCYLAPGTVEIPFTIATVTQIGNTTEDWLCSYAIISDCHVPKKELYIWYYPFRKEVNSQAILDSMVTYIQDISTYYGTKFVMVTGDISENGEMDELSGGKSALDAFSSANIFYVPLRGNHDCYAAEANFHSTFSSQYSDLGSTLGGWEKANNLTHEA